MKILIGLAACIGAIFLMSYVFPDHVQYDSFIVVVVAGLVLWLVNGLVRPLIKLIALPLTIVTLGLFSLVINTLMVMLTDLLVPGIDLGGFWPSFALAVVVSLLQVILSRVFKER